MCGDVCLNMLMGAIEVEVPRSTVAGVARDNSCVCQVGGVSLCSSERLGRSLKIQIVRIPSWEL